MRSAPWAAVVAIVLLTNLCLAESPSPAGEQAVERGKASLKRGWFPWYDSATDSAKPLVPPARRVEEIDERLLEGVSGATSGFTVLIYTFWALLIAALAWLLITSMPAWKSKPKVQKREEPTSVDRIEALPVKVRRSDDFLGEAQRCVDRGDFEEAVIYFFSYQLVTLDRAGIIYLAKGKTNRRYLREVADRAPRLSDLMKTSTRLFEETFFGHRPIDREAFMSLWNRRDEFARLAEAGR